MDKKYYMILNVTLLIIIFVTFYFQVRGFSGGGIEQWIALAIIGVVALISFLLQRKMKKEAWFIEQTKPKESAAK